MTRSEQSRINGARSHGPVSETGKAASSKNAIKHGLTANHLSVREDPEEFAATLAGWTTQLLPKTDAECRLVHRIAPADFRLERMVILEINLLDSEMDERQQAYVATGRAFNHEGLMALTFRAASRDTNSFELIRRYQVMLDNSIGRNVRLLLDLQKERGRAEEQPPQQAAAATPQEQNEPSSTPFSGEEGKSPFNHATSIQPPAESSGLVEM